MPLLDANDVKTAFSIAPELSSPQLNEIHHHGVLITMDSDQFVCWEGDSCGHLPFVIEGMVRVYKLGESGRELTLYRIHPGQSCILTASCILSDQQFPAHAKVEEPIRAIGIPANILLDWTERYEVWRRFVFSMMSDRLYDIIELVDAVTFKRLDVRLADYLLRECGASPTLTITHQELASELGSAREVISRVLKDFEQRGFLKLERGRITLTDTRRLKSLALL